MKDLFLTFTRAGPWEDVHDEKPFAFMRSLLVLMIIWRRATRWATTAREISRCVGPRVDSDEFGIICIVLHAARLAPKPAARPLNFFELHSLLRFMLGFERMTRGEVVPLCDGAEFRANDLSSV